MRERPIAEGVEMLRALGATIEYVEEEGRLPVRVTPSDAFKGGTLNVGKTASSQFISAVMLIAPWLEGGVRVEGLGPITSRAYVTMTSRVILDCAGEVRQNDLRNSRVGVLNSSVQAFAYAIEPDASSAVYWWCAAAISPFSRARVQGVGGNSPQPDVSSLMALGDARASTQHHTDDWIEVRGKSDLRALTYDCSGHPDSAVALAVLVSKACEASTLTGLHTLRHKETDRLAALEAELTKVGCEVETGEDWIRITPMAVAKNATTVDPRAEPGAKSGALPTNPVIIETYNDHRMAMAFAVLGLARPGISIRNPACVAKSYPTFWKDFAKLYGNP